ncbi:hypothetical protein A3B26_02415 [Candidatus Giovannonibacteria bacterium RIFCSPLOWO2_01_FULL_48_47]|nr:MAG: hypothetical protein A3D61_01510 [Candidatus Giovannonibacteria bacterium RIFCSPHIGHO2_02_FULL_48_15]OGF88588.1 MAG: hypothetical protein A3B26_02415 [Candidatus Giovannonibacteria bacterium RIFCSPLOWO2_01_FULL_48_47]OGF95314.1 MAG: hypothetical protein A2433_02120 [Candidatus Giovannonibacteria bacterium RIFOXYC1_FULL_48_8]OGF96317.1 MAG: hypothetical protein A2613_02030 [Candidatus Giovannonibacteria bacterium RIFOXYD1_FULL_48_21]HBT81769.1 hypothetical protein [Candidatus Giovannonib
MTLNTEIKIKKMEREIKELWQIVGDEIFWHPSVIDEIKKRSRQSHLNLKKLKTAKELFASI